MEVDIEFEDLELISSFNQRIGAQFYLWGKITDEMIQ